jgi:hypothetical protein
MGVPVSFEKNAKQLLWQKSTKKILVQKNPSLLEFIPITLQVCHARADGHPESRMITGFPPTRE